MAEGHSAVVTPMSEGASGENYLTTGKGPLSWLFTLDHKRISVMYMVAIVSSFLFGGMFALLVRTEMLTPGATIMTADTFNKMFTLHGVVMVFLFIIPGIPAALGNFVLPLMLGAKDVALPRLNLLGFWCWLTGATVCMVSIVVGAVDTGWTFYTPYSTTTGTAVAGMTLGALILGFSSILTGLNFIVTIHTMRPEGMSWFKMPIFLWSLYSTAIVQVLATPILGVTVLLLIAERTLGVGIFDPALGGDPVLYQHFFWFYAHPAVFIMILPAMGIISELVSVFSGKHIFGYRFIAWSSVAVAVFSFLGWGHHMFTSGQSPLVNVIFSALVFGVGIPSALMVFNWLATMYKGAISLAAPMLYVLAFLFLFSIGGLSGLFLGALSTNIHLHDTYFAVAHFHYLMFGGTVIAFLGGLHYWWPKMFGRMYSEFWARISAALIFVGFNLTFFTLFVMGSHGMPRRYYNYLEVFKPYQQASTVGSYLLGMGFMIMAYYLAQSLLKGEKAPENPWGGATLEWATASPPISRNFEHEMVGLDPYDINALELSSDSGGYVRKDPSSILLNQAGGE